MKKLQMLNYKSSTVLLRIMLISLMKLKKWSRFAYKNVQKRLKILMSEIELISTGDYLNLNLILLKRCLLVINPLSISKMK